MRYWAAIPKQTILVENCGDGDCVRCCVAALLGRPAESVPHFPGDTRMEETATWLDAQGFHFLSSRSGFRDEKWGESTFAHIRTGPTPRSKRMGQHHAVIWIGREMVYDPHPSEAGLTAHIEHWLILPKLQCTP